MSTKDSQEFKSSDEFTDDIPQGNDTIDNAYVSGKDSEPIPVVKDEEPVEESENKLDADSDETLARDDTEAIDKSNILDGGRTRGANPTGSFKEPGDEEEFQQ